MTELKPNSRKIFSDAALARTSRDLAACGAAMRQVCETLARDLTPVIQRAAEAMRRCGEPCHCLCAQNHPDRSLCRGEVPAAEVETVRFGEVGVPMCPPCAETARVAL